MVTKFASLATASALLLTVAPAAVAETIIGDVQFSFNTDLDGPLLNIQTIIEQIPFDTETGMFAEFESANVQMSIETSFFQGTWNGDHRNEPLETLTAAWTIIIEGLPTYGDMQIELGLYLENFEIDNSFITWYGEFAGAYGPPTGFGEPVSVAGNWTAQVVPAPGVASLLALTGLARRRRRD
jgi:hypothetical protein